METSDTAFADDNPPVPCRRATVTEDILDREAILFNPVSGATHRLNETALAVWRQCDGRTGTRAMAERLADEYEVDSRTALEHIEQLVVVFAEAGLLAMGEGK
jgi:PqqD family protein of HPr-rel-A system